MKLTVPDAARMLKVSETDIYRWIREGEIPFRRVGDHYRFHRAELLEWATARGQRISSDEFHVPASGDMPRLGDALEAGGIHYQVKSGDRETVLRAIVEQIPIDEEERETLFDFFVAREALGSTGIGEGIAIPHVRNPIVLHVVHPLITLCFLDKPCDFASIDGQPVHTTFSLVSATIRSHLYLLSRLAAALHDAKFKEVIARRAPRHVILAEARRVDEELHSAESAGKGKGAP
jgi:PTS system nitrogen regulatory IIA component